MGKNFRDVPLPCLMGILNITPDSFSDGGKYFDAASNGAKTDAVRQYLSQLTANGASIVDIGGESTSPHAAEIDHRTEWRRIGEVLDVAVAMEEISVSVDTHRVETARLALMGGANVINDVRGTWHFREMAEVVKNFDAHLIVTHNSRSDDSFAAIEDPVGEIIAAFDAILRIAEDIDFGCDRI
ncbi:MAG: dihydropteroate synthase, partial [Puniceicoccales bacterium]|nr:dihydropteroate synthase [Puniceicoccales bacterium]